VLYAAALLPLYTVLSSKLYRLIAYLCAMNNVCVNCFTIVHGGPVKTVLFEYALLMQPAVIK